MSYGSHVVLFVVGSVVGALRLYASLRYCNTTSSCKTGGIEGNTVPVSAGKRSCPNPIC